MIKVNFRHGAIDPTTDKSSSELGSECRIINVACWTWRKEGGRISFIERCLLLQPRNQIGIGQSQFANWHQVSQTGFDILIKIFRRCVGAIEKKRAFPNLAQFLNQLDLASVQNVEICQTELVQLGHEIAVKFRSVWSLIEAARSTHG